MKPMMKLLAVLIACACVLAFPLSADPAYAESAGEADVQRAISGTISLPPGMVAPEGGLTVVVEPVAWTGRGGDSTTVTIPAGESSTAYTFHAWPDGDAAYIVQYTLDGHYENLVQCGYYCETGTTPISYLATTLIPRDTDITGIDITMLQGHFVSGTVSLPDGKTAPSGGLAVMIQAMDGDFWTEIGSAVVMIPPNENTAAYSLVCASRYTVEIGYSLQVSGGSEYLQCGYYHPNGTVKTQDEASSIDVSALDATGINLTLIKGADITGTVSLPAGDVAPAGGINLSVCAFNNQSFLCAVPVTIPENEASAEYSLTCAPGESIRVSYELTVENPPLTYLGTGYYAAGQTVGEREQAALLSLTEAGLPGIDMTLIKGTCITGTISLPAGDTAPAGGINLCVYASVNDAYTNGIPVTIPENGSSAQYTLACTPGDAIRVYYDLTVDNPPLPYLSTGYYAGGQTTGNREQAALLSLTEAGLAGIDLTLVKGACVTGTVSLPEGEAAPAGGILLFVYAEINDAYAYGTPVTIPANGNSAKYSLICTPGDSVRIFYELSMYDNPPLPYLERGYHAAGQTTANREKAAMLSLTDAGLAGIDLTLIRGSRVTGTVSLPAGTVAPAGGLPVNISAFTDAPDGYNRVYVGQTFITVPENERSVQYEMMCEPADGVTVTYDIGFDVAVPIVRPGYYSASGTKYIRGEATRLNLVGSDASGVDLELIQGRAVSGTISRMEGGPSGLVMATVAALSSDNQHVFETFVMLEEGVQSAPYTLVCLPDDSVKIQYNIYGSPGFNTGYSGCMYYNAAGGTVYGRDAANLDMTGSDAAGIDVTLIKANTITGTIKLPGADTAPEGGITLCLSAQLDGFLTGYTEVVIKENENSAQYSLQSAPADGIRIGFVTINRNVPQYKIFGYYNKDNTVMDPAYATALDASAGDLSGIDITVLPAKIYSFGGVLQPVNADGSSIFRINKTVPVKFQLKDANGRFVSNAVASLTVAKVTNQITGTEEAAVSTAAATEGNLFRYDAGADQYVFNMSTKGLSPGTYRLTIRLDDGASYTVDISLR